jgi:hypothetical protein
MKTFLIICFLIWILYLIISNSDDNDHRYDQTPSA